jgi:hypothetical protein
MILIYKEEIVDRAGIYDRDLRQGSTTNVVC